MKSLEERLEEASIDKEFYFDIMTGKCFNSEGEADRGDSSILECGLPESVEGRNDEFSHYNFFGADARSVSVQDAQVSLYDLVFAEVKFNKDSMINTEKRPFYKLFQNHKRVYFGQKNAEKKYSKALLKYQQRKRVLKSNFRKAKTDKSRLKIKTQIEKINNKVLLVKYNYKIAKRKSKRHIKELKWISKVEEISDIKERFSSRNKESTFFDGASAYSYGPSNEVITTDQFSISLWFRTSVDQQDKRLFNLHRGDTPGSALNLSLKNGKVVMGLHDGTNYISNEIDFEYDDGIWHNYVVTKKKNIFLCI